MRYTIHLHHIVEEQVRNFGCTQCVLPCHARNQARQFPKLINTDNQSIVTIYLWQASDNVYCPILELVQRYWQWLQQPCRCLVNILNLLTYRTTSNILTYVSLNAWTPDTLLQCSNCFACTKMQSICRVVQLSYKLHTASIVFGHTQLHTTIVHNLANQV